MPPLLMMVSELLESKKLCAASCTACMRTWPTLQLHVAPMDRHCAMLSHDAVWHTCCVRNSVNVPVERFSFSFAEKRITLG